MKSITQDIKYYLSILSYADKHGVTKAAIKYRTYRQFIYRLRKRYDGTPESLAQNHAVYIITPTSIRRRKSTVSYACENIILMMDLYGFGFFFARKGIHVPLQGSTAA